MQPLESVTSPPWKLWWPSGPQGSSRPWTHAWAQHERVGKGVPAETFRTRLHPSQQPFPARVALSSHRPTNLIPLPRDVANLMLHDAAVLSSETRASISRRAVKESGTQGTGPTGSSVVALFRSPRPWVSFSRDATGLSGAHRFGIPTQHPASKTRISGTPAGQRSGTVRQRSGTTNLGHHGVVVHADGVPFPDPGVNPRHRAPPVAAGPPPNLGGRFAPPCGSTWRETHSPQPSRRRQEAPVDVLGANASLDGVALELETGLVLDGKGMPRRDSELPFDEVLFRERVRRCVRPARRRVRSATPHMSPTPHRLYPGATAVGCDTR